MRYVTSLRHENVELSLPHSREVTWILLVNKPECVMFEPERPTLIFLTIDPKQDLTGALYVKVSFSVGDFSIFCVVSTNETKMFEIE